MIVSEYYQITHLYVLQKEKHVEENTDQILTVLSLDPLTRKSPLRSIAHTGPS